MFLFFNFIDRMCFGKPSVDGLMVRFDDSMFVNGTLPNSLPRHRPFVGDVYGGGCALLAERSPFARHVGGWMWVEGSIVWVDGAGCCVSQRISILDFSCALV